MIENKGFTAGKMRRATVGRKVSDREPPAVYRILDEGRLVVEGRLSAVVKFCGGVKTATLEKRLRSGERELSMLRRPPEAPSQRRAKLEAHNRMLKSRGY